MKTTLTTDQIARYREEGFLVLHDFLAPKELNSLRQAVEETVTGMGKRKIAGDGAGWEEGDGYYDRVFTQRLNLWKLNEAVKNCVLSPDLGEMLCELAGIEGIRIWHDQALIKEPFGNPTSWHIDVPYWSFFSRDAISIWIALEDATLENGCLYYIPGSHRMTDGRNISIGENLDGLFRIYPELAKIDPVAAPLQAGGCVLHNGLTAHGAGANMTRTRRGALACAYMPDGSTFNGQQNILPESYVRALASGAALDDDRFNPVVFRK